MNQQSDKTSNTEYDVVIIGGGPSGSTVATYLSMSGISCLVLEKEHFPRPHVGESLVPACNRILKDFGLMEQMEKNFLRKYGAAWTTGKLNHNFEMDWEGIPMQDQVDIPFTGNQADGTGINFTYHVERGLFDKILLENSEEKGAKVVYGAFVHDVRFHDSHSELTYKKDGGDYVVTASYVVDATGRSTFLGNKTATKIKDESFNQVSIHNWFRNYNREQFRHPDYIYIHFLPQEKSWMWQIPITESITSIGIVSDKKNIAYAEHRNDLKKLFMSIVEKRPDVCAFIEQAEEVNPYKMEADYSYSVTSYTGSNYLLVGDAARFVDPIFSSGISIAMNGARHASNALVKKIRHNDDTAFADYEKTMKRGCQNWYDFICLYYELNALFTFLVGSPTHKKDILALLQGDVYEEDYKSTLDLMKKWVEKLKPINLGRLTIE